LSGNVADKETKKSSENNTQSPYRGPGNYMLKIINIGYVRRGYEADEIPSQSFHYPSRINGVSIYTAAADAEAGVSSAINQC